MSQQRSERARSWPWLIALIIIVGLVVFHLLHGCPKPVPAGQPATTDCCEKQDGKIGG